MKLVIACLALAVAGLPAVGDETVNYEQLPPAVKKAADTARGTDKIKKIQKEEKDGKTVYQVEFDRTGLNPKVLIAQDGSLIRDTRTLERTAERQVVVGDYIPLFPRTASMTVHDVPEPVRKTVEQQAAGRKVVDIDKETWNGQTVYEVEFSTQGRNQQIHVAENGVVVQRKDEGVTKGVTQGLKSMLMGTQLTDTPSAVQQTVRRVGANAEIADIDKETRKGQVVYEVELKRPGKNRELHITEDGAILKDSDQP